MELVKELKPPNYNREPMTVSQLTKLYGRTIEALEECANVCPANDEGSESAEAREASLMDVEACLLSQAADIEIRTDRDVMDMVDVWAASSGILSGVDVSPSDRIALNIFRHLTNAKIAKN